MKPIEVQRKRTKGFKLPLNTVSVTRPGKWGNPFKGEDAVKKFRECLLFPHNVYTYLDEIEAINQYFRFKWMQKNLKLLRDKNLACFCHLGAECHRTVLLELANK